MQFDGQEITAKKFKKFANQKEFRRHAVPLISAMFKPIESFLLSKANGWISLDLGIVNMVTISQIEVDDKLIPCFMVILKENNQYKYTELEVANLVDSRDELFDLVYEIIQLEKILENYVRQNFAFLKDAIGILGFNIDIQSLSSNAEAYLKNQLNRINTEGETNLNTGSNITIETANGAVQGSK